MPAPAPDPRSALELVVRRDRLLVALALAGLTVLAWIYLVREAASMNAMALEMRLHAAMGMANMHVWGMSDWLGLFAMWSVMMVGMMLPSAAPVILLVLGVYRRRNDSRACVSAFTFMAGYVLAWTAFSAVAAAGQVGLHRSAVLADDMALKSGIASGLILLVAGAYQWLPVKNACLTHCQSPLGFLQQYWREGILGAFALGARHGLFCIGCCWLLMALLFVLGVMNLLWVAALAAFVLIEKLTIQGAAFARVAGIVMGTWGIYLLVTAA